MCVRVHMQMGDLLSTKTEKQMLLADIIIFSGNLICYGLLMMIVKYHQMIICSI